MFQFNFFQRKPRQDWFAVTAYTAHRGEFRALANVTALEERVGIVWIPNRAGDGWVSVTVHPATIEVVAPVIWRSDVPMIKKAA